MKKILTLSAILFLPAFIYIYFALGIPKVRRAPIYGPREAVQVTDAEGKTTTDTSYYTIPAFSCLTTGGLSFSSKATLDGRSYVAIFLPPDSIKTLLGMLAEDLQTNKKSYGYARFVFFLTTDSSGHVATDAPDVGKDLGIGVDSAFNVYMTPEVFDSVRLQHYFIHDPAHPKDPWQTTTDAVLIDRLGRIRGYYNIRFAADIKKMKEDVNHILLRDEGVQTLEESKVEQKHEQ
jgi:hypothetical protein